MKDLIGKETRVLIAFDIITFKWHQTITITGRRTVYDREITVEITAETAKEILNTLDYQIKAGANRVDFEIETE